MANNLDSFVWKSKDGATIKMMDMDVKHLQFAHTHACLKEYDYHVLTGFFCGLRDQLEAVAEARGIELRQLDKNHPDGKCRQYFCNSRKTKAVTPKAITAKVSYIGLKQVNAQLDI